MASKPKSKWVDDEQESVESIEQRKREKEKKKRLKEEKLRKAAAVQEASKPAEPVVQNTIHGELERPAKRQRISDEDGQTTESDSKLLPFPTTRFGPCRDVNLYQLLNNIEEGSYGMVSRARSISTGEIVALKRLKMEHTNDGFPVTGLREIQTLMASRHPNIVNLREVVMGNSLKE
jgi:cell division cycle 2-like